MISITYEKIKGCDFDLRKIGCAFSACLMVLCVSFIPISCYDYVTFGTEHYDDWENGGFYDLEGYDAFIEGIREVVDEDAYGAGNGVTEIYMKLGWTNKTIYYNVGKSDLKGHDSLFVNMYLANRVPSNYTCVKIFYYKDMISFGYYVAS